MDKTALRSQLETILDGPEWDQDSFRTLLTTIADGDARQYLGRLFELCQNRSRREPESSGIHAVGDTRLDAKKLYDATTKAIGTIAFNLYMLGYDPIAKVIVDSDRRRQENK